MTWKTPPPHSSRPASKAGCSCSQPSDHVPSLRTGDWPSRSLSPLTFSASGSQTACQALSAKRRAIYNQSRGCLGAFDASIRPWAHSSPAWESCRVLCARGCLRLQAGLSACRTRVTHGGRWGLGTQPPASNPLGAGALPLSSTCSPKLPSRDHAESPGEGINIQGCVVRAAVSPLLFGFWTHLCAPAWWEWGRW